MIEYQTINKAYLLNALLKQHLNTKLHLMKYIFCPIIIIISKDKDEESQLASSEKSKSFRLVHWQLYLVQF